MDYLDRRYEMARRDLERAEIAERLHCAQYWAEQADAGPDDLDVRRLSPRRLRQELARARARHDLLWAAACGEELRLRELFHRE